MRIESTVEVAGKRITAAPQTVVQRYDGGPTEQNAPVLVQGTERVTIDSTNYNCEVQQMEMTTPMGRSVTKTCYSDKVFPYVLRRETITTDAQNNVVSGRSTLEVVAVDMPARVLHETQSTAHIKAFQQHEKGSTVTLAVTAPDVPGGIVSHSSKERDAEGRIVRRSTLELTDYSASAGGNSDTLPRRPRMMRRHRGRDGLLPGKNPLPFE